MKKRAVLDVFLQANGFLGRLPKVQLLGLAVCGVLLVGGADYGTGYEVSVALFYLLPVAIAAWHAGSRWAAVIAGISCISWYLADIGAGSQYTHSLIPVWNSLVRLGFFSITGFLVATIRSSLDTQHRLARTDSLTGLYVRRAFQERLEHDLAMGQRLNGAVTLAYLDLDNFKAVNDTYGHAAGDKVLQTTAWVLQNSIRHTDTAARLGGEEFALLLPDTDTLGAQQVIATLTQHFQQAFATGPFRVECSIGVVTFMDGSVTPDEAIAATDAQMYEVKRAGNGGVGYKVLGKPLFSVPAELHSVAS